MTDEEKDRRSRLTKNLTDFRDGDINPVHAAQGRVTKLEGKKKWVALKSTLKFKGLGKKKPVVPSI